MEALENGLLQIPPRSLGFGRDHSAKSSSIPDANSNSSVEYPEATAEIENGVHQLETLLESTVDKAFDYFEIWSLRNVLTIPDHLAPWMRLGHYEVHPFHEKMEDLAQRKLKSRADTVPTESTDTNTLLRPNTRIHPPTPAQTSRNQKAESSAALHPLS